MEGRKQQKTCIINKKAAKRSENKNKKNNYSFQSTKKSTTNQQQKSTKKISTKKETKCQQQNQNININQNELYNFTTLFERILQHLIKHNKELVLKFLTMALGNIVYEKTEEQEDGVEDSAASSYDKLVAAGLSQKETESDDESLTLKQPIESRTDILWDLSEKIPKDWKNIGRKLGLDDSNLDQLARDYIKDGHNEIVYQMLKTWKQRNGSQATYIVLGEALKAAGRRDQQEILYKKAMEQRESYSTNSSSPGAAIHQKKNEDTLDNDKNENINYSDDNNNEDISDFDRNEHIIINTQNNKKTLDEIKSNMHEIMTELRNNFSVLKIIAPMPSDRCIPLNDEHNDIKDNKKTNKDTACEMVFYGFLEINPSTPKGLYIPSNNEIKRQYDIQDNKKANKDTNFHENRSSSWTTCRKVFSALGIIASIYFNNHNT